jgi:hypothetical protein
MSSPKPSFPDWESIFTTDSEPIAHFILGKLQNEGIEARIHKESVGSAFGINVGLLGKVDVLVRATDFERAMSVLEDDEDYDEDDEDEDDEGEDREI